MSKPKKPFYKKWWVWIIAIIVIGSVAGGGEEESTSTDTSGDQPVEEVQAKEEPKEEAKKEEPKKPEKPKNDEYITMDEFSKIANGMTYEEVVKIIGSEGELMSTAGSGEYETKILTWYADNKIANANVTFVGNKVEAKAQLGLD